MRFPLTACLLVLSLSPAVAPATDYYVKNGGDDGLAGTSLGSAWATLARAAAVVGPGDTVHVQDGSYAGFYLSRSGAPGQPITFVADGDQVQITADNGTTPDGTNIEGAAHVVIDGFVVNGRTRAGIRTALSQFVTIRNCTAGYNGRWGIFTGFADDLTVENNHTHHSVLEHGIYVSNSGDRPVIRGNLSHDNYANGIHMNGDLSQGGDGVISHALVENNVIYGNGRGGGSGINLDGVSDSVVRNNLLFDNHASGISLYRIDGATGSRNNLVVNNTIVNAADARWCINLNNGSTGNRLHNNILYTYHSFRGVIVIDASSRAGFLSDYNSLMNRMSADGGSSVVGLAAWQALGYDTHSLLATPSEHFVTPGSDFHLRDDSPAIDAGDASVAPARDLEGNPRPVAAGVDLGAYERQLPDCGDGDLDPGEQCGEPGSGCDDACTTCTACSCVAAPPLCGDGLLCGAEQCESDGDCDGGQTCRDCTCINPPLCAGDTAIDKATLRASVPALDLRFQGRTVIAKPWIAVDPIAHGIRLRIDSTTGAESIDLSVPAGAAVDGVGWTLSPSGTWKYRDRGGVRGPVTQAVVRDLSRRLDGQLAWSVRVKGGSATLPAPAAVRGTIVLGAASECAQIVWNGPGGAKPRCAGDAEQLRCR